jgi:hypothetical protein
VREEAWLPRIHNGLGFRVYLVDRHLVREEAWLPRIHNDNVEEVPPGITVRKELIKDV